MSISIPNVSHREGNTVLAQGPNVVGNVNLLTPRTLPLYRDYNKVVSDLITKNFPSTYRLELNTAIENGMKFAFAAERKTDRDTNAERIFVSSQIREELRAQGINFIGTIDSEKLEGELSVANLGVNGLKLVFKGKFLDNDKQEASGELQYQDSSVALTLGLFNKDNASSVESSAVASVLTDLSVGGSVRYNLPTGSHEANLDNFSAGVGYAAGRSLNFSTTFTGRRNPKSTSREFVYTVGSRVFYTQSSATRFAADVNYDISKSYNAGLDVKLVGEHAFDANTTIRGGVEKSGKVRAAIAQKLNSNVTFTLGTEVNALRLEEHNVGATLSFSP